MKKSLAIAGAYLGALDRRMSRFERRLTPLHFAIVQKRPDMVRLLIERGADLEATDANGHTPLEAAMLAGETEAVRLLQASGARVPERPAPEARTLAEFAREVRRITPMLSVPDVRRAIEWYVALGFSPPPLPLEPESRSRLQHLARHRLAQRFGASPRTARARKRFATGTPLDLGQGRVHSTRQNRMTTSDGYRSPVPTNTERASHCSSGAEVSKRGTVRK